MPWKLLSGLPRGQSGRIAVEEAVGTDGQVQAASSTTAGIPASRRTSA